MFEHGDGAIPYFEAKRAVVGWSDPLCAPADLPELLGRFTRELGPRVCLVMVDEATTRAALAAGFSAFKVGEEPWFDLATWHPPRGDKGKKYRWAVNHARGAGVEVDEHAEPAEVEEVVRRWRTSFRRPEPESVMRTAPLEQAEHKRIFLARRHGAPEAVLACARLPAADGWYLEDLVRVPEAPNGATELLVAEALARLEGRSASFALAPMRGLDRQLDPRARWLGKALAVTIRGFDRRYGFRALARYEGRFLPTEWRPRYVAFLPALPRPSVVRAAVRQLTA